MPVYILKRLFQALFVVIAVTLLVSYAIRLSGDPTAMRKAPAAKLAKYEVYTELVECPSIPPRN